MSPRKRVLRPASEDSTQADSIGRAWQAYEDGKAQGASRKTLDKLWAELEAARADEGARERREQADAIIDRTIAKKGRDEVAAKLAEAEKGAENEHRENHGPVYVLTFGAVTATFMPEKSVDAVVQASTMEAMRRATTLIAAQFKLAVGVARCRASSKTPAATPLSAQAMANRIGYDGRIAVKAGTLSISVGRTV